MSCERISSEDSPDCSPVHPKKALERNEIALKENKAQQDKFLEMMNMMMARFDNTIAAANQRNEEAKKELEETRKKAKKEIEETRKEAKKELEEAYLIKYSEKQAAQLVVSKDVILKRAVLHPQYDGKESGLIIKNQEGIIEERNGCFWDPTSETLVGGWCRVEYVFVW